MNEQVASLSCDNLLTIIRCSKWETKDSNKKKIPTEKLFTMIKKVSIFNGFLSNNDCERCAARWFWIKISHNYLHGYSIYFACYHDFVSYKYGQLSQCPCVLCVHTMVARQLDHFCFVYIILLYFLVSFCLVCNLITSHIWINNTNIPKTKCKILKMDERLVLNCDHDSSVNDSYRTLIKSNKNHQFLFNFSGARFG